MVPVTFDAAVTAIILVFGRIAFSISEALTDPSLSALITDWVIPRLSNPLRGRSTELCSIDVVIT